MTSKYRYGIYIHGIPIRTLDRSTLESPQPLINPNKHRPIDCPRTFRREEFQCRRVPDVAFTQTYAKKFLEYAFLPQCFQANAGLVHLL